MSDPVFTRDDLRVMQAWPLEKKIRVTQAKILEWHVRNGGKVVVNFSGGLDSTVLLDLARRIYPNTAAVFCDTGLEYPENRAFVGTMPNVTWVRPEVPFHKVVAQWGYPVISKDVAKRIYYARRGSTWAIYHLQGLMRDGTPSKFNARYKKWAYLVDAPFLISDHCCEALKKAPLRKYCKETGNLPIVGTMADESVRRQSAYLKTGCNAFQAKEPLSKPLSFWTRQNILTYIQRTGLPYYPIYGDIIQDPKNPGKLTTTGCERTGCMWCMFGCHLERKPNRFQRLALTHPRQYDYCINRLGCGEVLDYLNVPYRPVGGENCSGTVQKAG